MTFIEKLQVIERVDGLIRRKATGTAEDLASKLGVSRRCVYDILDIMKQMDAPIQYCPNRKSIYYSHHCDLAIGFIPTQHIKGGNNNYFQEYFPSADFLHKIIISLSHH